MTTMMLQARISLKGMFRDRLLYGVMGVAFFMILLVPVFSNFSMRQVQELAITLSLSTVSLILLVISVLLGSSSVWRDIERRYTASVLSLPISRTSYVCGKFMGIALFLLITSLVLMVASAAVIAIAAASYPSTISIPWQTIVLAIILDLLKYLLLTAFAILFSTVSTSFFLPFFGTLAIYFVGNSSQEVYEFVTGPYGKNLSAVSLAAIKSVYYLLPNFAGFSLQVQAVYGLPVQYSSLLMTIGYGAVYTGILLACAVWAFNRRELP